MNSVEIKTLSINASAATKILPPTSTNISRRIQNELNYYKLEISILEDSMILQEFFVKLTNFKF